MRRYPARRPKDYRWEALRAEGTLPGGAVLIDVASQPSNAIVTGARQTINLQRMIGHITLSVLNDDLTDLATELYTRASWMLLKVDNDDSSNYDPEASSNLQDEVVLAHGESEFIGYGTTQSLLVGGSGIVLAQTAVCMAYCQIRIDLRSNRKIAVENETIKLYITRPAHNEIGTALDLSYESTWRNLYKIP